MNAQPGDARAVVGNVEQAVPFFFVRDMSASLKFYVDGLGMLMTHKWDDDGSIRWCWLRCGDAALMLQEYSDAALAKIDSTLGVGVSVCFVCKDALALYREFVSNGINATEPFVGNNMWVVSLADPDGYRIDFESTTDVAEGTLLSQIETG